LRARFVSGGVYYIFGGHCFWGSGGRSGGGRRRSGFLGDVGISRRRWRDGSCFGFRLRFDTYFLAGGLQRVQVAEAAGIVALDAAFVAVQVVEDVVLGAIELKCPGQRVGDAIPIVDLGHGAGADAVVEIAGFDAEDAAKAVGGDGQTGDEVVLDLASGVEVYAVLIGERLEVGGVFAWQDGGCAGESVDGAVAGGARFARCGAGSGTLLRIFTIGIGLRL